MQPVFSFNSEGIFAGVSGKDKATGGGIGRLSRWEDVLLRISAEAPPPAFVLCVRGESFALGEGLSPAAARHAASALELLQDLCRDCRVGPWQERAGALAPDRGPPGTTSPSQ